MVNAPVFAETYRRYLDRLQAVDLIERAERLGAKVDGDGLLIPLYDRLYRVSGRAISTVSGTEVSPAVRVILACYVLSCPDHPVPDPGRLVSYREFPDAAPLLSYFASNATGAIEAAFSGRADRLGQAGEKCGGRVEKHASYDVALRFLALPQIPVVLYFNDRDDLFPAACSLLYHLSAGRFLDMECLAMTGTLLAALLVAGR
ncbi:DUF3786 domain-containing protein [Desulfofustis limnaeus]|uniref:DUF3786 domain-containing protein n=1 Tax=Desulfofustis limnaeus TaxID=2740163 RepID=A0ABM7WB71_9BACT|nr:DUF3786 domain-containing protein [Desulfofustis limnaeus]BDD88224.1 hypothetical protein DPPLL_25890 [Desulfofustis limnaeus]